MSLALGIFAVLVIFAITAVQGKLQTANCRKHVTIWSLNIQKKLKDCNQSKSIWSKFMKMTKTEHCAESSRAEFLQFSSAIAEFLFLEGRLGNCS